ncbi:ABC transporter substrate-binding protein [Paracandidimonas lactea]|uniref:ABC transporter substrate-binding protein n=1 Tax=Paracandidimonas lactea TaxID=2895524 RepID=UPI001927C26A|nr:ABC transporter substrate-binding protein [Paracandidimonas lactea]
MRSKHFIAALTASLLCLSAAHAETLRWGPARDIGSMDPYAYGDSFAINVLSNVYEGLVRYNRDLKIEPALAASWEVVSPDTWRFKLRKGVKFHNGNPFTADDVIASLDRVSDPASPLKGNLPAYKSVQKIDDHTVDITLTGTYPLLLNDLTNILIFDKEWLTEHNALKPTDIGAKVDGYPTYNANGTGPFKLESRQPDAKTVFVKNTNWWDTPQHNLDRIEFTPISSPATRVAALLSGEIDFVEDTPIQDLPRLKAASNVRVLERTDLRTIMFGMNRKPTLEDGRPNPFNKLEVRQALQHAIDLNLLKKRVMRDKSRVAGTLVAPEIPGYDRALDTPAAYDPELAKKLLAKAGYPDGFDFTLNCFSTSYVNEEQICQAVASMFSRIGVKPKLDVAPRAIQLPKRISGKTDMYTLGWANEPMLDSYSILVQVLHTKNDTAGVFNWGGWSYPKLDAIINQAGKEMDAAKRVALETEALKLAKDEVLMIPLHQQPIAWAVSTKFKDFPQTADNKPRLWYVK